MKNNKKEIIIIAIILLVQTIVFVVAGFKKSYLHMDEALSIALTHYDKLYIQDNEDFFNTWHNSEYYKDYMTIDEEEKNNFKPVYENQKNDVHPPLYYLLLRIAENFNIGSFSKWPAIILNIIIYLFTTVFMYLIIKKLLTGFSHYKEKSAILALISGLIMSSINNVIYIRMYALANMCIVITTYLHLRLLDKCEKNNMLLLAIGLIALIGSLTHYYYLIYLAILAIMFVVKYMKDKNYKALGKYICTMIIAGIVSVAIFPYSIQHIFFGYRGQGVIDNLIDIPKFIVGIGQYLLVINEYTFNMTLLLLIIFILGIIIYKQSKRIKLIDVNNKYVKYIAIPTFAYFILIAISAPWKDLRYMMPVCNLIFILVLYFLILLLKNITKEKTLNKIILLIFVLMAIMPTVSSYFISLATGKATKIEPQAMYSDKKDIVEMTKNELSSLPALYIMNSGNERFLDDILLFMNIDESYIALDIECSEEKIKKIFLDKDTSNGVIVFINDIQDNEAILNTIKEALNLENVTHLERLNSGEVYLVK